VQLRSPTTGISTTCQHEPVREVEEAARLLLQGAIVGTPTDTVYGIAADPHHPSAVARLFALKGRHDGKPIGLLVADFEAALTMVVLPEYARQWAERHWPGPLNLVAEALFALPAGVGDRARGTVGVRVPDHPVARALLALTGPLAVTSANLTGQPETLDDRAARALFGDEVARYLPGSCPGQMSSTTVDVSGPAPILLRRGPLDLGL
jgi:tRNA threonylcarbamoyl adenosine modification protein (Sua5/YciO/YrdC/YwlC family)